MKAAYYAIWSLVFMLPMPIKILVELGMLLLAAAELWFLLKYVLFVLSRGVLLLNIVILGGIRRLLGFFGRKKERTYILDEQIGQTGKRIDQWVRIKGKNITKLKFCSILAKKIGITICVLALIYLTAILPVFKLEKYISDYYIENIYFVNRVFESMENYLTKDRDQYPPLIQIADKEEDEEIENIEETEEVEEIESAEEPVIYLEIKEEKVKANVRDAPSMNGTIICVISVGEQIVYLHEYQYAEDRYWLKVAIPAKDNLEGWVSEHVIREDLVEALNLQ